jgi:hypothetical protein
MRSIVRSFLLVTTAASAMCALAATPAAGQQIATVRDPRPVAAMVLQLETSHSWRITYEDPPYANDADIDDVTDQVVRDASERSWLKVLVPKTRTLSVPRLAGVTDESKALRTVVIQYNAMVGYEAFQIVQDGPVFHVIPKNMKDGSGQLQTAMAVLDTKIAIGAGERSIFQLIDEICAKISVASGTPVKIGTVPQSLLRNLKTPVSTAGRKQSARAILDEVFSRSGVHLSWRLLFDPKDRFYALNLHEVPARPAEK